MGGPVAVGVRLTHEDKTIVREVYTSGISMLFESPKFFEQEIFHIQANLLHEYAEKIPFAPHCYGLVFGDFKTKKIHSMQGYSRIGHFGSAGISLSMWGNIRTEDSRDLPHHRLRGLVESDNVFYRHWDYDRLTDTGGYTDRIPVNSWDEVLELMRECESDVGRSNFDFTFTVDGWEIINYEEELDGVVAMFNALVADGIEFSDEDIAMWDEYIDEREMLDDPDGEY